jgi:hypothetical protein
LLLSVDESTKLNEESFDGRVEPEPKKREGAKVGVPMNFTRIRFRDRNEYIVRKSRIEMENFVSDGSYVQFIAVKVAKATNVAADFAQTR